jgi:type IV pilus assembly protein PilE
MNGIYAMQHMNRLDTPLVSRRRNAKGFSLIELMVVLAIMAILLAIAVPSYQDYLVNARRAEAKAVLMRAALWMERNQTASFSYVKDAAGTALTANTLRDVGLGRSPENAASDAVAKYLNTLAIDASKPNEFLMLATAQGSQASKDPGCAVLILNHLGQRGRMNGATQDWTSNQARECWAR